MKLKPELMARVGVGAHGVLVVVRLRYFLREEGVLQRLLGRQPLAGVVPQQSSDEVREVAAQLVLLPPAGRRVVAHNVRQRPQLLHGVL